MEEAEIGEVGTDKVAEGVHEKAKEHGLHSPWVRWLALSTAIFAVMAAIASLESGQFANESLLHMNEATLKQAKASDAWAYYQAKGIKQYARDSQASILASTHAPEDQVKQSRDEAARLKSEQDEIQKEAQGLEREQAELQEESRRDLKHHHTFAYAVTTLQVAIGLSAVAALVERRGVWFLALVAGAGGIVLFILGFLSSR
jgi:hypothetical protein